MDTYSSAHLPLPPPPPTCKPPAQRFLRKRYAAASVVLVESKLMHWTTSMQKKKRAKMPEDGKLASFRAGGRNGVHRFISDRISYVSEPYDSLRQKEIATRRECVSRFMAGAFLPAMNSPRPPALPPLQERVVQHSKSGAPSPEVESPRTAPNERVLTKGKSNAALDQSPDRDSGREKLVHSSSIASQPNSGDGSGVDAAAAAARERQERAKTPHREREGSVADALKAEAAANRAAEEAAAEKQNHLKAIFKKVSDEGMVHKDDLPHALTLAGAASPKEEWIVEVAAELTKYSSLDFNEFQEFIETYFGKQRNAYREAFNAYDSDGSGSVDTIELKGLFQSFGIEPMNHVLEEAINEVDLDGTGNLDFEEFELIAEALNLRAGFTKVEYEDFTGLFKRFDRDSSGTMDAQEAWLALQWLGFPFSQEEIFGIVLLIDKDNSGLLDEKEWMLLMKLVREKKIEHCKEVMKASDADGDGKIHFDELEGLIRAMGFVPDREAICEAAEEVGIARDDDDVDIGEMWRLLQAYRSHEGLSRSEIAEVDLAFYKYADSVDQEVNIVDVGKVVRSIGYTMAFETQQKLVREVDIDNSGKLDIGEFRKMIRLINRFDLNMFRLAFEEAAGSQSGPPKVQKDGGSLKLNMASMIRKQARRAQMAAGKTLNIREAKLGLKRVLGNESVGRHEDLLTEDDREQGWVDFFGFCSAAKRGQAVKRVAFRKCGGFNEAMVARLRDLFKIYDRDASGEINGTECIQLLEAEFPSLAADPKKRPEIQQLMLEADENGSGTLDFGDFLRLMRNFKDMHEQLQIAKELSAVSETGFSAAEVLDFRELFTAVAGGGAELDFEGVKTMLGGIVPMGSRNTNTLRKEFDKAAARSEGVHAKNGEDDEELMDFPEFLWLMKALLDMDFANMNKELSKKLEPESNNTEPASKET